MAPITWISDLKLALFSEDATPHDGRPQQPKEREDGSATDARPVRARSSLGQASSQRGGFVLGPDGRHHEDAQ